MTIRACDVYDVLGLPSGLRTHMARTAAVVGLITRDLPSGLADVSHEVKLAMALHDVGNVVKGVGDGSFLGENPDSLERWRLHASYTRVRYGEDDHLATAAMLSELRVKPSLIELIVRKSSRNLPSILERGDSAELLAIYADMRIGPTGFVSIVERHEEARARYANTNRRGLGGDVTLSQLNELQVRVGYCFGVDPERLNEKEVEAASVECMEMDIDDAFQ